MEKKILLDLERLRYPKSGVANVAKFLALGISKKNTKFPVSLYGPKEELVKLNIPFSLIERKSFHKLFAPFQSKFSVVHVTQQLSSYFHKKYKNQKKIVTLHDLNFLHEGHSQEKIKKSIRTVQKNIGNADVIVCISEFVKKDLLENIHLFSFQKKQEIQVVYNGLDFPNTEKVYDLGKFNYLKNKAFILNIGVLFPKKNQLSILKMLPQLSEDLVLVVSGSKKEYEEEILISIKKHQLETRVHILRNISEEEKYALLQNCKAMIHPSLAEGFGIPPIEAMAFGKPVFLSKLTSLPEIGGEEAFYFDNFETEHMLKTYLSGMQKFETHPDIHQKLKDRAQQFSYLKMAENYMKIYEKLLIS